MALSLDDVALFRHLPALRGRIPWVRLGAWPTPVEPLHLPGSRAPGAPLVYVKREDRSSPRYGGNKIRTLEPVLACALKKGATTVWATGAYGSNHALATVLHARHLGLEPGAALFPQPRSTPARANLAALLSAHPALMPLPTVAALPLAMSWLRRQPGAFVMAPGAASPRGALGALSASLELAEQVAAGVCPAPARIVLAVGSTCTTAGLLAGLHLAARLGIAFRTGVPAITAVRVTPWPITSPTRIALLAWRTLRALARLLAEPDAPRDPADPAPTTWHPLWHPLVHPSSLVRLNASLTVDPRFLGRGYGRTTAPGHRAMHVFEHAGGPPLDVVYSAKSGAALLDLVSRRTRGPVLFWATKSSALLPRGVSDDIARAPRAIRRWLGNLHFS